MRSELSVYAVLACFVVALQALDVRGFFDVAYDALVERLGKRVGGHVFFSSLLQLGKHQIPVLLNTYQAFLVEVRRGLLLIVLHFRLREVLVVLELLRNCVRQVNRKVVLGVDHVGGHDFRIVSDLDIPFHKVLGEKPIDGVPVVEPHVYHLGLFSVKSISALRLGKHANFQTGELLRFELRERIERGHHLRSVCAERRREERGKTC